MPSSAGKLAAVASLRTNVGALPRRRRLRGYAFDPQLSTELEFIGINSIVYDVPWEVSLAPGPCGEYVEVVDVDPASGGFYTPVDLNQIKLVAEDGLAPAEGNPQFHQQMVYAVVMTTVAKFEAALGRRVLWSPRMDGAREIEYVGALRVYPHAMREQNAYYDPDRKALLFGYFPAGNTNLGRVYPGGVVFTCLSQDIVAHETTHAILDGIHRSLLAPTNPDVLAFHEAFADIVALFQHFSYPDVLRDQIAKARGDLRTESLLGQLAVQFGLSTGSYGALRSAIGVIDAKTGAWQPLKPDPTALLRTDEPHARGSILVAAVFDAFLRIYSRRVEDLLRIATSGSGVLPEGALHPDLVNRLATEAAKSAGHVLHMCVRALDYCPPVDLDFGDYLRALLTADAQIVPTDDLNYRVAIVEAFRARGIYPRGLRSLSVDSLLWGAPPAIVQKHLGTALTKTLTAFAKTYAFLAIEQPGSVRENTYLQLREWRKQTHDLVKDYLGRLKGADKGALAYALGIDHQRPFEVRSLQFCRKIPPEGTTQPAALISVVQRATAKDDNGADVDYYGGSLIVFDLAAGVIDFVIGKNIKNARRQQVALDFHATLTDLQSDAYLSAANGMTSAMQFALLHAPYEE